MNTQHVMQLWVVCLNIIFGLGIGQELFGASQHNGLLDQRTSEKTSPGSPEHLLRNGLNKIDAGLMVVLERACQTKEDKKHKPCRALDFGIDVGIYADYLTKVSARTVVGVEFPPLAPGTKSPYAGLFKNVKRSAVEVPGIGAAAPLAGNGLATLIGDLGGPFDLVYSVDAVAEDASNGSYLSKSETQDALAQFLFAAGDAGSTLIFAAEGAGDRSAKNWRVRLVQAGWKYDEFETKSAQQKADRLHKNKHSAGLLVFQRL